MTDTETAQAVIPASSTATIPMDLGSTPESFSVPEQYAEKPWAANVRSLDDMYSQFDNMQGLVGKKNIPGANATDEETQAFYNQLRPETADKYELTLPDGVKAEINQDEQNLYKQMFHDLGLTPKQANALFQGHVKLEMEKAGKLAEGQPTPEEAEAAKDVEFGKLVTEKLGDKADEAIKITMAHALQHSQETMDGIKELPPEQMAAIVDLISSLDSKIPKNIEDGMPGSGDAAASQSIDQKVIEANKIRMSPEVKDLFHPENSSKRELLKRLDSEIQKALNGQPINPFFRLTT